MKTSDLRLVFLQCLLRTYKKVAEQFGNRIEEKVFISNINNIERQIAKFKPKKQQKLYASMSNPKVALDDTDVLDMNIQIQHRKVLKNSLWMSKDYVTLSDLLVYRSNLDTISNIDREFNITAEGQLSPLHTNHVHRILVGNHFSSEGPFRISISFRYSRFFRSKIFL